MRRLKSLVGRIAIAVVVAAVVAPAVSVGQVVYGNLGSSGTGALGLTNTDIDLNAWVGQGFSTGTSTSTTLQSITMGLFYDNSLTAPFTIKLYNDISGQPGTVVATSSATSVGTTGLYTFPFSSFSLSPSTTYWAVPNPGVSWYRNATESTPTEQNSSGYQYSSTLSSANGGGSWTPINAGYSISVNAVPEPASIGLMVLGAAGLGVTALRRMRRG